jgi:hypothetical protein
MNTRIKQAEKMAETADSQWRSEVSAQMRESAVAHQQTAVILERIQGKLDSHDLRIKQLENVPGTQRANVQSWAAVAVVIVAVGSCIFGPLIAISTSLAIHQFMR